jgi:hypothetical protein
MPWTYSMTQSDTLEWFWLLIMYSIVGWWSFIQIRYLLTTRTRRSAGELSGDLSYEGNAGAHWAIQSALEAAAAEPA